LSTDAFADVPRETLLDVAGRPVLHFLRTSRDGLPAADLVVPAEGVSDEAVAAAALEAFAGWAFSGSVSVGRLLVSQGAAVMRHAHVMTRDLVADPPDASWAGELPAGADLSLAEAPLDPRAYLELIEAAYPPGHPDHVPRSEAERLAHDIVPLLDGSLGPLLDASQVAVEPQADGRGRLVAICLINDFPDSGPWVTDVARLPDTAYAGLGALLLRRSMAQLAAEGRPTVGLAVSDGNPARRTYDRHDFVEVLESLTVKLPDPTPSP
jgi:hypothetical protein